MLAKGLIAWRDDAIELHALGATPDGATALSSMKILVKDIEELKLLTEMI